jgi:hypothetical protein
MAGLLIARTERGNRNGVAQRRSRPGLRQLRQLAVWLATTAAVTVPVGAVGVGALGAGTAQATVAGQGTVPNGWTPLTMRNGWTTSPFGTSAAAVRVISGIVHLKGAIATTGTNPVPFTLPAAFSPAAVVFIPVDLCNATNGRLQIEPSGVVTVEAEGGAFSNAACFTSLDGASFARSATAFTRLRLQNGWTNAPFGTSSAAARVISGIVHLKGAIATTGTNPVPFTLPVTFRPHAPVDIPLDLCDATNGRLQIRPNGTVFIQAESGDLSNAACFTSLDGASFAR